MLFEVFRRFADVFGSKAVFITHAGPGDPSGVGLELIVDMIEAPKPESESKQKFVKVKLNRNRQVFNPFQSCHWIFTQVYRNEWGRPMSKIHPTPGLKRLRFGLQPTQQYHMPNDPSGLISELHIETP